MTSLSSRLWVGDQPLVLASASKARQTMLTNAGIEIDISPSDIDESGVRAECVQTLSPLELASLLAERKALSVSMLHAGRLVLGADQTLDLDGECFAKAGDFSQAAEHLRRLSGRKHRLHSAFCFARDGVVVNSGAESAELTMRVLSDHFIWAYLDAADPDVLGSVGLYQLEGLGVHLFESVDGDWFTILGLPLIGVVGFLRSEGLLRR